jgi:hypothetical protein
VPEWPAAPAVQRVVAAPTLITDPDGFPDKLVTTRDPSRHSAPGHLLSSAAPTGVVYGLTAPTLPVQRAGADLPEPAQPWWWPRKSVQRVFEVPATELTDSSPAPILAPSPPPSSAPVIARAIESRAMVSASRPAELPPQRLATVQRSAADTTETPSTANEFDDDQLPVLGDRLPTPEGEPSQATLAGEPSGATPPGGQSPATPGIPAVARLADTGASAPMSAARPRFGLGAPLPDNTSELPQPSSSVELQRAADEHAAGEAPAVEEPQTQTPPNVPDTETHPTLGVAADFPASAPLAQRVGAEHTARAEHSAKAEHRIGGGAEGSSRIPIQRSVGPAAHPRPETGPPDRSMPDLSDGGPTVPTVGSAVAAHDVSPPTAARDVAVNGLSASSQVARIQRAIDDNAQPGVPTTAPVDSPVLGATPHTPDEPTAPTVGALDTAPMGLPGQLPAQPTESRPILQGMPIDTHAPATGLGTAHGRTAFELQRATDSAVSSPAPSGASDPTYARIDPVPTRPILAGMFTQTGSVALVERSAAVQRASTGSVPQPTHAQPVHTQPVHTRPVHTQPSAAATPARSRLAAPATPPPAQRVMVTEPEPEPEPAPAVSVAPEAIPTATVSVQAAPEPGPAPTAAAGASATAAAQDIDALVRKLYDPIARKLKAELRLDRERAGIGLDLRH